MELNNLISDLTILIKLSDQDYHAQRFEPYQDYLNQFNELLLKSKSYGIYDIEIIMNVPDELKGLYGLIGSDAEKAKLREIVSKSQRLLERLNAIMTKSKSNGGLAMNGNDCNEEFVVFIVTV